MALVTASSSIPASGVDGEAFDRPVMFWPAESVAIGAGLVWQGLGAVPVDTPAGPHELSLRATTADGAAMQAHARLRTVAARSATRRLTVDPRFGSALAGRCPRHAARRLTECTAASMTEARRRAAAG